jgi:hypothetical protein
MENEKFHKAFDVNNESRWNAVSSKALLKPEILRAYCHIDMCAEFISKLLGTIDEQAQQILQLSPSLLAERSLSMQFIGDTENRGL